MEASKARLGKGMRFPHGSKDEARLLNFLRAACVASFGSSDPEFLKEPDNWPGAKDGLDRLAMASLLRHFTTKAEPGADQPATKPADKVPPNDRPSPMNTVGTP